MDFKIPHPKIPTRLELLPIERVWYSKLKGVKFGDWNKTLRDNSYPIFQFKLDWRKIRFLLADGKYDNKQFDFLAEEIDAHLNKQGWRGNFFIKLESRSPKDYLYDDENFGKPRPLKTAKDALYALALSMRTFEDLCSFKTLHKFQIIIRPYISFHPKNEWRCFIKGRKLVGISQYYYAEVFDGLNSNGIADFINDIVIPNMTVDSYIADVVNEEKPILLETNPWGFSDPCLFKDYCHFDGSILINS